jgi:hypothetical protein
MALSTRNQRAHAVRQPRVRPHHGDEKDLTLHRMRDNPVFRFADFHTAVQVIVFRTTHAGISA